MSLDKNKAYRFRGGYHRWEFLNATGISQDWWCNDHSIPADTFEYLYECEELLEYPELPDNHAFCEYHNAEYGWSDEYNRWVSLPSVDDIHIYCRAKDPAVFNGEVTWNDDNTYISDGVSHPSEIPPEYRSGKAFKVTWTEVMK